MLLFAFRLFPKNSSRPENLPKNFHKTRKSSQKFPQDPKISTKFVDTLQSGAAFLFVPLREGGGIEFTELENVHNNYNYLSISNTDGFIHTKTSKIPSPPFRTVNFLLVSYVLTTSKIFLEIPRFFSSKFS